METRVCEYERSQIVVINQRFPPLPGGGSLRIDAIAIGLQFVADGGKPVDMCVLTSSIADGPERPFLAMPTLGKAVASDRPLFRRLVGEI